jgi:predicted HicB family RNase H-like nuclease
MGAEARVDDELAAMVRFGEFEQKDALNQLVRSVLEEKVGRTEDRS